MGMQKSYNVKSHVMKIMSNRPYGIGNLEAAKGIGDGPTTVQLQN